MFTPMHLIESITHPEPHPRNDLGKYQWPSFSVLIFQATVSHSIFPCTFFLFLFFSQGQTPRREVCLVFFRVHFLTFLQVDLKRTSRSAGPTFVECIKQQRCALSPPLWPLSTCLLRTTKVRQKGDRQPLRLIPTCPLPNPWFSTLRRSRPCDFCQRCTPFRTLHCHPPFCSGFPLSYVPTDMASHW